MIQIIAYIRAMQIATQHFHNLCARTPFHSDHEFFSGVYESLQSDYDSVIERHIGIKGEEGLELKSLMTIVMKNLEGVPSVGVKENSVFYNHLLKCEQQLCMIISETIKQGVTPGTEQLLGDICNASEVRQYKIKQRIKK